MNNRKKLIQKMIVCVGCILCILGNTTILAMEYFRIERRSAMETKKNEVADKINMIRQNGKKIEFNLDIGEFVVYKVINEDIIPEVHNWYAVKYDEVIHITKTQDLSKFVQNIKNKDDALYFVRYASSWIEQPDGVLIVYGISDAEAKGKLSEKEYSEFKALNLKETAIRKDWRGNYVIERNVWAFPYKYEQKMPFQILRVREIVTSKGGYKIKLLRVISEADWLRKFMEVIM